MKWKKSIKIKQFLTANEDEAQKVGNLIADVLNEHYEFRGSLIYGLRNIPKGDDVFTPTDYLNKLLDGVYDIADEEAIWIE